MNIIVTGGAGFIGSALVKFLLSNTKLNVIVVDNLTYAGNLSSLGNKDNSRLKFILADIGNKSLMLSIVLKFKPQIIFNLAAESHVDRSIEMPDEFIQTNIVGTFNLLEAARKYWQSLDLERKSLFRFVHVSTDEVFGALGSSGLFTETSCYKPNSPYSASKAASDHLVRAWYQTYQLPTIITNCSNNYGPYHFPEKLIPHIIISALSGKSLPLYGDGLQIRDWLYVDDHVNALYEVATNGRAGETYNIGGNCEKTNISIVQSICDYLDQSIIDKPFKISTFSSLIIFVKDRPGHDKRYAIDSSKITRELGWRPQTSFEQGLANTISWYINNKNWWHSILDGSYRLERIGELDKEL